MNQPLRAGKFYFHNKANQAIAILGKVESPTYGKCWIVELAIPTIQGSLIAFDPQATDEDWHEGTKEGFIERRREVVRQMKAGMAQQKPTGFFKKLAWWKR